MKAEKQYVRVRLDSEVVAYIDAEARRVGLTRTAYLNMRFRMEMAKRKCKKRTA